MCPAGQNMGGPTTAVPIVENLRDTWPLHDDLGPVTRAQREAIAEAADTIEQLYEALATLTTSLGDQSALHTSDRVWGAFTQAMAALAKARGEELSRPPHADLVSEALRKVDEARVKAKGEQA